jgi:uncharacterized phage protein gp47/JayE
VPNTFIRPTLGEIRDRVQTDLNTRLSSFPTWLDSRLTRSLLFVLAHVLAGVAHLLHGHLAFIARQIIPDTARADFLDRWSTFWGVPRAVASQASGPVTFTGIDPTPIPLGTEVQIGDGTLYTVDASVLMSGGAATVQLTASETGLSGNAAAGVFVSLVTPIAGVDSPGTVDAAALTGGLDTELDDSLRDRLATRVQTPPQGGALADYIAWTQEKDPNGPFGGHGVDVDRVFVSPLELGAGTVVIRFTTGPGGASPPIPTGLENIAVAAHVLSRRPVTAIVGLLIPVADPIPLTITLTPNGDSATEAEVSQSLGAMFERLAVPGGTIDNSTIREAISASALEQSHTLDAVDGGSGLADIVSAPGDLAALGVVTFA